MTDYEVMLENDEDGVVVASVSSLDGCFTQGRNDFEAMDRIHEAIEAHTGEKPGFVCTHKFMRFNPLELDAYFVPSHMDDTYKRISRPTAVKLFEAWRLLYRFNSIHYTLPGVVELGYSYDTHDLACNYEYYVEEMYKFAALPRSRRKEIEAGYERGTRPANEELDE
ncbi:MAG: type II toxin-antitoxin system HicB family antitoxin [Alphaproteobacteria bacterium]|nr:type II toxin-antitoxin system HicB family antitoxin [Alphaproteobacteria bacterium]MDA8029543.1 type II toxin-antitoxin system HicB family antitoxin [Alphaproteobacteria bacterium]